MTRFAVSILILVISACFSQAAPVDLSPPSATLGAASSEGYLLVVREIDEVDFGNGLKLPVRIQFKSQPGESSQILGSGWKLFLAECSASLFREGMMKAEIPCGKRLWLYSKKRGSMEFETLDAEWKAKLEDKTFTVSREDGWQIKYVDGRIVSVKTDSGRLIQWHYDGKNVTGVSEGGNNAFKILLDQEGKLAGLSINDRQHKIELGQRPRIVDTAGQRLVEALDMALVKWTYPDGKVEEYNFALDSEHYPTLARINSEKKNTDYSWDAKSGYIRSEGEWKYVVGQKEGKFGLPNLARTDAKGMTEKVEIDNKTGITSRTGIDGVKTVSYRFKSPGPLYNKVQKIETVEEDVVKSIYKVSYYENGRIARKTTQDGVTDVYFYSQDGKIQNIVKKFSSDPAILAELSDKEKSLKAALSSATSAEDKSDATQALAFFYVYKTGNYQKALDLIPAVPENLDPNVMFNIKFHVIEGNSNLTEQVKIELLQSLLKEYPEKSLLLNSLIESKKAKSRAS